MVGGIRLIAKGDPGHTITIKYAELLHDDGTVAQENLRSARATDEYIMKGEGYEVYEPLFTYHGFRYVQVEGYPNKPEKNSVTGLVFHNAVPVSGKFVTSNDLINKIQKNLLWGLRGNFHSVPTDCPQRDERLGWMGDAQVIAPTACYNFNMAGFFTKWQQDILDGQDSAGWVYDVNPPIVVDGPASPGWGDAVVVVPWVLYNFYGDEQILKQSYTGMKAWVDYMESKSENYLYHYRRGDHEGYADWISVEKSPQKPVSAAYFFYSSKLLAKIADVLGKPEDAAKYLKLSENIATAFNETYFDPETNNYEGATQTANLIPVAFGITPEEKRAAVMKNVADNIKAKGVHPTTGFLGTPILLPMLTEYGYGELAYQMVNQTSYPSWGYMIEKGATTMWELWNSDTEPPDRMNSRNHFALGVIGEWFYGYLAGIRPMEEAPGFKKFIVEPSPLGDLKMAQANYVSPYGNILSKWEKDGEEFKLTLSVPANTIAQVRLPKIGLENPQVMNQEALIFAEGKPKSNPNLTFTGEIDGRIYFEAEPGNYELVVKQ
jgi:alpha-L-rhamnosidase